MYHVLRHVHETLQQTQSALIFFAVRGMARRSRSRVGLRHWQGSCSMRSLAPTRTPPAWYPTTTTCYDRARGLCVRTTRRIELEDGCQGEGVRRGCSWVRPTSSRRRPWRSSPRSWSVGDLVFVECEPQPIRYQYLMRRRADFSHDAYLKRYEEIHSQFGDQTRRRPRLRAVSRRPRPVTRRGPKRGLRNLSPSTAYPSSTSPPWKSSPKAVGPSDAQAATADEELFMDRPNSVMFTSDEVIRL